GGVGLAERHPLELDTACASVLLDDPHGRGEELELDALVLGVVDLAVVGAHLFARASVYDRDVRTHPPRRASAVEGGEAAAHHDDLRVLADWHGVAPRVLTEVVDRLDHAGEILAGDAQLVARPRADADEHGVVA